MRSCERTSASAAIDTVVRTEKRIENRYSYNYEGHRLSTMADKVCPF